MTARRAPRRSAPGLVVALVASLLTVPLVAAAPAQAQSSPAAAPPAATKPDTGPLTPRLSALSLAPNPTASAAQQSQSVGLPAEGPGSLLRAGRRLVVYVIVDQVDKTTLGAVESAGAEVSNVAKELRTLTVRVPIDRLDELAAVGAVSSVSEALAPTVGRSSETVTAEGPAAAVVAACGSRTSEGDTQLRAALGRDTFGVDGTGVTVGVLSDSFDLSPTAATRAGQDVASGDLPGPGNPCGHPTPVQVLQEDATTGADEGRAMSQIVHDLAPGAALQYASAFNGINSFADNIRALRNAGSSVIVDDVSYFEEPFFQDGPVSVAVNDVTATGTAYFSSAANSNLIFGGQDVGSYEAPSFRPAVCPVGVEPYVTTQCHDFNPGAGVDTTYGVTLAPGGKLALNVQWAEPWFGVGTDIDVYIVDAATKAPLTLSEAINPTSTQHPAEFVNFVNNSAANRAVEVVMNRFSGTGAPRIKMIHSRTNGVLALEYNAASTEVFANSIFGHNGAEKAGSTAAIPFNNAEVPESFSSRGRPTLVFGPVNGTTPAAALPAPQVLDKPDYAATDGTCNTFFIGSQGADGCFRFFGTSAAAPHAAAVAALVRQLAPGLGEQGVQDALRSTAAPMAGGSALSVGAGRIDAVAALGSVQAGPTLTVGDVTVPEADAGITMATFPLRLSEPSAQTVTASYTTTAGTAGAGDFTAAAGTATFAPGVTSVLVNVRLKPDSLDEPLETFTLDLTSPVNAVLGDASGAGNIVDNDAAPNLTISDVRIWEGNGGTARAYFTARLSSPATANVTVGYNTVAGTASTGTDFTATSGTLVFTPGQVAKLVPITVSADVVDEPHETFTVTLSGATGALVADASGTATILDDDPSSTTGTPTLRIGDLVLHEGDTTASTTYLTVRLSAASASPVTASFTGTAGTAGTADFSVLAGTMSIPAGAVSALIPVVAKVDALDEPTESFTVVLSAPTGATVADGTAVVSLLDNDAAPRFAVSDVRVVEGNAGAGNATFTVRLAAPSTGTVSVAYSTVAGSAAAGSDFTAGSATLTFAPNQVSKTVTVRVTPDLVAEPQETFSLLLSGPVGALVSDGTGVATVVDDD